jgi:type I restriction enzyme M protein
VYEISSQRSIWQVLDHLRGTNLRNVDVGVALAALMYLRWADFEDAEREAIAAFEDTHYEPVLASRYLWRTWCNNTPQQLEELFGELPFILGQLGNRRQDAFATQLARAANGLEPLQRLDGESLSVMVRWLANQPFETPADRLKLSDVLDEVLSKTSTKQSGQYFSPRTLATLMAGLAKPQVGESIYDPCFGSAGLLTASLEIVRRRREVSAGEANYQAGGQPLRIFGVERVPDVYLIGLTRLVLSGVIDPQIELGDSLERVPASNPGTEGFDIVIANPPWGGKVDLQGLDHYPIQSTDSSALFVQHALAQLRPGGRAIIAVPPSLLFRKGREEELRRMLVEDNTLEAIVAIPRGSLAPNIAINVYLLLLRRGGKTKTIRMVDAASDFEKVRGSGLSDLALIDQISRLVRTSDEGEEWWDVDVDSLSETHFDLTPKRRDRSGLQDVLNSLPDDVRVAPLSECSEIRSGQNIRAADLLPDPNAEYLTLEQAASMVGVDEQTLVELRSRGEVFGFRDGSSWKFRRRDLAELALERGVDQRLDVMVPYVRIGDVNRGAAEVGSSFVNPVFAETLKPEWKLRAGDVLLSKSGTIGKAGIVRNGAVGAVASSGFFILRASEGELDPHYLLAYLQSAEANSWLDDHARGSAARHLSASAIKTLPVPIPPLQIQQRVGEECRKFGFDALVYLAELLSEDYSDSLPTQLNGWVASNRHLVESIEDDDRRTSFLEDLESIARSQCPVNICKDCNKPYHLDFNDRTHLEGPVNYEKAIRTTCLACWLDVGPSPETIESLTEQSPLVPWAFAFQRAVAPLENIAKIPDAVGVYSLLQSAKVGLLAGLDKLEGRLPNERIARELTKSLSTHIDHYLESLLSVVTLVVDVLDSSFENNETMKIRLRIQNQGKLPLHDLEFQIKPPLSSRDGTRFPYVGPGTTLEMNFTGTNHWYSEDTATALQWMNPNVRLSWTGRTMGGTKFQETRELAVDFTSADAAKQDDSLDGEEPLGGSPYICGDPVKPSRAEVFFGREDLLKKIKRTVIESGNVVLLEGNRRAGKSSILWHLEGATAIPGWLGIYCSLQGAEGDSQGGISTADVFRGIAYEIIQSVRKLNGVALLPDGTKIDGDKKLGITRAIRTGISDESPFQDFREYLEAILETLASQGLGILLMLDEFDKLQEGIDKGVTSPQVPENIRFLVQSFPRFSAILTGSRRLKRMREEYWSALFGLGTREGVTALPKSAAVKLITEPVKNRLVFAKPAIDRCYDLTAGQPYLLQCLCNRIFDVAAHSNLRSITIDHVEQAAKALVKDNEHFASLWDYSKFDRRRFLLCLLWRERNGADPLRLGVIETKLEEAGVELQESTLIADLEFLIELELIDLNVEAAGAHYTLTIPMMGQWIESQQDYEVLRSRARAEAEDLTGKIKEFIDLQANIRKIEKAMEDDDD